MWLSGEIAAKGPLRRTKGGAYYGDTHRNLHGACDEAGNREEGTMFFRVAVDALSLNR
jgi:hypothetical protein